MAEFIRNNRLKILISFLGGAACSFILAVNLHPFWTIDRFVKLLVVFLGTVFLSVAVFALISIALYFRKNNSKKVNTIHIYLAFGFALLAFICVGINYTSNVPSKWILSAGKELEIAALILSGIIAFPLISFGLSNSVQLFLWTFVEKSIFPIVSKHYQEIFTSFLMILMIAVGVFLRNPTATIKNFSMNTILLKIYSWTKYQLGDILYTNAILGENGWLSFADLESIPDMQNSSPFSDEQLQVIERNVTHFYKYLDNLGIELYFIFPPNKNTIYPEYIPKEIPVMEEKSRMDQVIEMFEEHPEIKYVDLEPIFMEGKKADQIYFSTDTHWNAQGEFLAYTALIDLIHKDFPDVQPYPIEYFTYSPTEYRQGDISGMAMLNIKEDFSLLATNNINNFVISDNGNFRRFLQLGSTSPRMLMYHDSFGEIMIYILIDHFSYNSFVLGWTIDPLIIEAELPDIVIIEMTERKLYNLLYIPNLWED